MIEFSFRRADNGDVVEHIAECLSHNNPSLSDEFLKGPSELSHGYDGMDPGLREYWYGGKREWNRNELSLGAGSPILEALLSEPCSSELEIGFYHTEDDPEGVRYDVPERLEDVAAAYCYHLAQWVADYTPSASFDSGAFMKDCTENESEIMGAYQMVFWTGEPDYEGDASEQFTFKDGEATYSCEEAQ